MLEHIPPESVNANACLPHHSAQTLKHHIRVYVPVI